MKVIKLKIVSENLSSLNNISFAYVRAAIVHPMAEMLRVFGLRGY